MTFSLRGHNVIILDNHHLFIIFFLAQPSSAIQQEIFLITAFSTAAAIQIITIEYFFNTEPIKG